MRILLTTLFLILPASYARAFSIENVFSSGIGGLTIGAIALLGGFYYFFRNRRRKLTLNPQQSSQAKPFLKKEPPKSKGKVAEVLVARQVTETAIVKIINDEDDQTVGSKSSDKILTRAGTLEVEEEGVAGKECLNCAEIIRIRARVCPFCGYKHSDEELAEQKKFIEKEMQKERLAKAAERGRKLAAEIKKDK